MFIKLDSLETGASVGTGGCVIDFTICVNFDFLSSATASTLTSTVVNQLDLSSCDSSYPNLMSSSQVFFILDHFFIYNIMKRLNYFSERILQESASEEAWELVGQTHSVISSAISSCGFGWNDNSVELLSRIIEDLPQFTVDYSQIKHFHNLENRESDEGLLKEMRRISFSKNSRELFRQAMIIRDLNDVNQQGEFRQRGYDPVLNYDRLVLGDYEPPVIFYQNSEFYVVGGRTRIYASVAAGIPIRIKVITKDDLKS